MTKIFVKGKVLSNDSDTAVVRFDDGVEKFYTRDVESKESFKTLFPLGGTIQTEKIHFEVSTRADLFALFERVFGKPDYHGVALVTNKEETEVMIGVVQNHHGCFNLFCTESMSHPAAADTKGFALQANEETYWFTVAVPEIEDALAAGWKFIREKRHHEAQK
jgi:hypothetical protein